MRSVSCWWCFSTSGDWDARFRSMQVRRVRSFFWGLVESIGGRALVLGCWFQEEAQRE